MAKKWIKKATGKNPGSFTAQAKRRGMSPAEFQRSVLSNPKNYSSITVKRANLRKTLVKMEDGSEIGQEEFSLGGILGSVASGAGTGALFGAGPVGGIIGGIVGLGAGIFGHAREKKAEREQLSAYDEQNQLLEDQRQDAKQDAYLATIGSNQAVNPFIPTFPLGGLIPYNNAEVEDDEILQRPNGKLRKVDGARHEQGGIDVNEPSGTRVYSDREIYKPTGKTFAEEAEIIMKRIAELEK